MVFNNCQVNVNVNMNQGPAAQVSFTQSVDEKQLQLPSMEGIETFLKDFV